MRRNRRDDRRPEAHPAEDTFKRPGCFTLIRGFFAVLACFTIGALMLIAPDDLKKEISDDDRMLVARLSIGFGALFGATLFFSCLRNRAARAIAARLRGLLLVAVMACVLWLCHSYFVPKIENASRLAESGLATTVVVEGYERSTFKKETYWWTRVRYLDGKRASIEGRHGQRGQPLDVVYLEDDRDVLLPGKPGLSFIALLGRDPGHGIAAIFTGLALAAFIFIPFGLWRFVVGKRIE